MDVPVDTPRFYGSKSLDELNVVLDGIAMNLLPIRETTSTQSLEAEAKETNERLGRLETQGKRTNRRLGNLEVRLTSAQVPAMASIEPRVQRLEAAVFKTAAE